MNIGVVLNYFRYFLDFANYDVQSSTYYFITSKRCYTTEHIPSLEYCNWREYHAVSRKAIGDVDTLFTVSLKLGLIPMGVDCNRLCAFYEYSFEQFFEKHHIDFFLSGGVSGFERVGLATARRMGIKTLCVWEGMFRPYTISVDPTGMNAESSIAKASFPNIMSHLESNAFGALWNNICERNKNNSSKSQKIKTIMGDRFNIRKQFRNRLTDRSDIERIRLSFHQLAKSRMSYYAFKNKYISIDEINAPYILFALQTHTDSNIIINTEFGSIDPYVDLVLSVFKNFHDRSGINLIVKEHPMDLFRKSYKRKNGNGIYWANPAISVYNIFNHDHCKGTIVINSTAGLESLIMQKPVLCLGQALYRYPELVELPETLNSESLLRSLEKLIENKVNKQFVKKLCGFLYDKIQIDGNIETNPSPNEISYCDSFFRSYYHRA
jgi:capsular polysaccharide export protein